MTKVAMPLWRRPLAIDIAVFLLCGIAIMTATWSSIVAQNVEIGDFAANGLLIQDAKHLALFKGNYSRIGVHHPGPAILYVLAFGELFFNDLLHLTKSPLSGQLIAACFYTAGWNVAVFREFRKLSGTWTAAALLTSVFLVTIAFFNYNFFADIWFPDLYVFPFAAMTLAMARLGTGRVDSLLTLAISAGFLFNGHVSFVSTLGVIFLITVFANTFWFRGAPDRRILGAVFIKMHRKAIAIALLVLALFFVPLAIETIVSFPGPIGGYLLFGADRAFHPLRECLLYLANFWGGLAPMTGALAAAALVVVASRRVPAARGGIASLMVVLAASTVALFVYARYGIDYLVLDYLGYYYYTTAALLFAVVAYVAWAVSRDTPSVRVAVLVLTVCLFLTYWKIDRPVRDVDQYNHPGVVTLYDGIKGAATHGRVVLDLDNRQDWGWLWTNLVGAEVIAKRRHEDLFCLNKNWHILFTKAAICTPEEVRSNPRYTVRVERGPRTPPVAFDALDIVFSPYVLPDITDAGYLSVQTKATMFNDYLLASGWSPPEGEHVWSSNYESHLAFRVRDGFSGVLVMNSGAFLVPGHERVTGKISVNNQPAITFQLTSAQPRQMLEVPINAGGTVDVKVTVDNPTSPLLAHVGDDPRVLGISLFGLEVKAR